MTPRASSGASGARMRLVALRRLVAALALGAFVIGCLEPLVAEAHDGDAAASISTTLASGGDTGTPSEPVPPTHALHLCHCTHAHGASTLPSTEVSVVLSLVEETAPRRPLMAPSSVTLDGLLRPPASARA